jgi:prepilin-type N-terminal cleavage/methylation domain-containing protein
MMTMKTTQKKQGKARHGGFTLLEIVVTIAVIALMLGVVVSRMDTMMEWDMKKASGKLASTMRYLYNKAATEGLYIRLVLDFEESTYWVEATTDPFVISAGEEDERKKKKNDEETASEEGDEGQEGDYAIKPQTPVFTQVDSYLLKPTKLPGSILFKDVFVEHLKMPVDGGKAEIYFFPNGMVEHAIINLRDENDEVNYSLETSPVSGRVKIEDRYRSMEER